MFDSFGVVAETVLSVLFDGCLVFHLFYFRRSYDMRHLFLVCVLSKKSIRCALSWTWTLSITGMVIGTALEFSLLYHCAGDDAEYSGDTALSLCREGRVEGRPVARRRGTNASLMNNEYTHNEGSRECTSLGDINHQGESGKLGS